MRKTAYGAWKLHFAVVVLSMVLGGIIAAINIVVSGDMFWFWLIAFMPIIVYVTALLLGLMVIFGLGLVAMLLWHSGRSMYRQIDQFFKDAETDRAFRWSKYFRIAGYMLLAWVVIILAVFIIVNGVQHLPWW